MTSYEKHIELLAEIAQAKKEEALANKCADRRVAAYLDQLNGTNDEDKALEYSSDLFREFEIVIEPMDQLTLPNNIPPQSDRI